MGPTTTPISATANGPDPLCRYDGASYGFQGTASIGAVPWVRAISAASVLILAMPSVRTTGTIRRRTPHGGQGLVIHYTGRRDDYLLRE